MPYVDPPARSGPSRSLLLTTVALGALGVVCMLVGRGLGENFQNRARFFAGGAVALQTPQDAQALVLSFDGDSTSKPEIEPMRAALSERPGDPVALVYIQGQAPVPSAAGASIAERLGVAWRAHHRFDVRVLEVKQGQSPIDGMTPWTLDLHTRAIGPRSERFAAMHREALSALGQRGSAWSPEIRQLATTGGTTVAPDRPSWLTVSGSRSFVVAAIAFYVGLAATTIAGAGALGLAARRLLAPPTATCPRESGAGPVPAR